MVIPYQSIYRGLYRVRPFVDMIIGNFKKCHLPGEFLAVDESMVKWSMQFQTVYANEAYEERIQNLGAS